MQSAAIGTSGPRQGGPSAVRPLPVRPTSWASEPQVRLPPPCGSPASVPADGVTPGTVAVTVEDCSGYPAVPVGPAGSGGGPGATISPASAVRAVRDGGRQRRAGPGVAPTTFAPDAAVAREQMAVLLARALQLSGTGAAAFTDSGSIDAWAAAGVRAAASAGYVQGFPNGSFQPAAPTTRAQAAQVLAQVLAHLAP